MKENLDPALIGDMEEKIRKTLENYLEKIVLSKYPIVRKVNVTTENLGDGIVTYDIWLQVGYNDLSKLKKDIKDEVREISKQALLLFWTPESYRNITTVQYYE
jgi:hypothetical protein